MNVNNYTTGMIISMLQNKSKIEEARYYKGDINACDLLMDLEIILRQAKLTDKQTYVLNRYYIEGYTQEEVAQQMGVTQQMCNKYTNAISKKISKVLYKMKEGASHEK